MPARAVSHVMRSERCELTWKLIYDKACGLRRRILTKDHTCVNLQEVVSAKVAVL